MLYSSQRRAAELIVGLEGISCEESLRTRGLLSLEKTNLRGNLVALFKFLWRESREGGAGLPSLVPDDRTCAAMAQNCTRRCSGQIVVILQIHRS